MNLKSDIVIEENDLLDENSFRLNRLIKLSILSMRINKEFVNNVRLALNGV